MKKLVIATGDKARMMSRSEIMGNDACAAVPSFAGIMADDALVGIISIGDIVKHHVVEVEMETTAMREYITCGSFLT
jgi:hypothetical protein